MNPGPYLRPLVQSGPRPPGALPLAGGPLWFQTVEVLRRDTPPSFAAARDLPPEDQARLCAPRAPLWGQDWARPLIMGILNVTPDSFSDGGHFLAPAAALAQAKALQASGVDLLDIGGESTRPGAAEVPEAEERARIAPVFAALKAAGFPLPLSVDTRKASVAEAALAEGAMLVNDVSALGFDPEMAGVVARSGAALCLMHAQGRPETMQKDPRYDDVLLDVYDGLAARIALAESAGIARARLVIDPGIGFGKTLQHNLALLAGLSLFHGLGCPLLLGVSRKGFIGALAGGAGGALGAGARLPGSLAAALAGLAQGVQILRVHDGAETRQALRVWRAIEKGGADGA